MRLTKMAYASVPAEAKRGAMWLKPELVAQVRFATWTADDLVRQAAFLGLREDKAAKEVRREGAEVAPRPKGERAASAGGRGGAEKRSPILRDDSAKNGAPGLGAAEGASVPEKFYVRPRNPKSAKADLTAAAEVSAKLKAAAGKATERRGPAAGRSNMRRSG